MIESCEKLSQYVRRNLGSFNAIAFMKVHEQQDAVSFRWYEKDFVVKKSLEAFEVKGQKLFVTGASILMQAVLDRADADSQSVEAIVSSIRAAEDMIADEQQRNSGFKLLANIRATLKRMANSRTETTPAGGITANGGTTKETAADSAPRIEPVAAH